MRKFPRLEAMRTARDSREREAAAPIRAALFNAQSELRSVSDGFKSLERVVMSDFGKHLMEEIHHRASRDMYPELAKAFGAKPGEMVTITIPAETLRFLRPSDAEGRILDQAVYELQKRARVKARKDDVQYSTVVSITFPQFSIQTAVVDEVLAPRRARV